MCNESKLMFILSKRSFSLLYLTREIIEKYTCKELRKIEVLRDICTLNKIVAVSNVVDLHHITRRNVVDLYKYVSNLDKFCLRQIDIDWGPGNNKNSHTNAIEHYKKHAQYKNLSEDDLLKARDDYETEYLEWSKILFDDKLYLKYPVEHFYNMKDVMVHTNGKGVYMSGFYMNVFIVGRYEGDKFGISSCYYVKNGRKKGREVNKVFDLTFK